MARATPHAIAIQMSMSTSPASLRAGTIRQMLCEVNLEIAEAEALPLSQIDLPRTSATIVLPTHCRRAAFQHS